MRRSSRTLLRSFRVPSKLAGGSHWGAWTPSHPGCCQGKVPLHLVPRCPNLPLLTSMGRGRSFEDYIPPSSTGGRHSRAALMFLVFQPSGELDGGGSSFWIPGSLPPPPPTCVTGTSRDPFLCLRVCQGSGTSRRGWQDAGKMHLGTGIVQAWVITVVCFWCKRCWGGQHPMICLSSQNSYVIFIKFNLEMISVMLGSMGEWDYMFLINLKDAYFKILIHPDSRPYLRIALKGKAYQFKAFCFGLSTAPQVFTRVIALVSEQKRGIPLLLYLDDWLMIAESVPLLLRHC